MLRLARLGNRRDGCSYSKFSVGAYYCCSKYSSCHVYSSIKIWFLHSAMNFELFMICCGTILSSTSQLFHLVIFFNKWFFESKLPKWREIISVQYESMRSAWYILTSKKFNGNQQLKFISSGNQHSVNSSLWSSFVVRYLEGKLLHLSQVLLAQKCSSAVLLPQISSLAPVSSFLLWAGITYSQG